MRQALVNYGPKRSEGSPNQRLHVDRSSNGFINLRTSEIHSVYNLQLFYWHFLEILWLFIYCCFLLSSLGMEVPTIIQASVGIIFVFHNYSGISAFPVPIEDGYALRFTRYFWWSSGYIIDLGGFL